MLLFLSVFTGCASVPDFQQVTPSINGDENPNPTDDPQLSPSPEATQNPEQTPSPSPTLPPTEPARILKSFRPSLAVRGASCLVCHAKIEGNMITDFGYGDSFFFGGSSATASSVSWYNNYAGTWQTLDRLNGTVFVPAVAIPYNVSSSVGYNTSVNIIDFMTTPYQSPQPVWLSNASTNPMAANITPPTAAPKIATANISIRAPTEDEVLALAPALNNVASGFTQIIPSKGPVTPISGLITQPSGYTINDPLNPLICSGADIVIKGSLYLREPRINADQGGCRLYVAGSVFIEGAITYIGSSTLQNLQISSSRMISMGVDRTHLVRRLIDDNRGARIRGSRTFAQLSQIILAEADAIGTLKDASTSLGTPYPTARSYWNETRVSIDYSGLLLNAPLVQSRYLGKVRGSIVAELALFSLGEFNFEFDPILTADSIPILPLFADKVSILQTQ